MSSPKDLVPNPINKLSLPIKDKGEKVVGVPPDFIKEQYIQLNKHRGEVNSYSAQILAILFAGLVLSLGLKSEHLDDWNKHPLLPAVSFFAIGAFFVVWLFSHQRNIVTRHWLDSLIAKMEEAYGIRPENFGLPSAPKGKWWLGQNFHSSKALSVFLALMAILALWLSAQYWMMVGGKS